MDMDNVLFFGFSCRMHDIPVKALTHMGITKDGEILVMGTCHVEGDDGHSRFEHEIYVKLPWEEFVDHRIEVMETLNNVITLEGNGETLIHEIEDYLDEIGGGDEEEGEA